MVKICVGRNKEGVLLSISSQGHADEEGAGKVPCALVTEGLKTFGLLLNGRTDLHLSARSSGRGSLEFDILPGPGFNRDWYSGVQQYVLGFLQTIASDYPELVSLRETEKSEGKNGT